MFISTKIASRRGKIASLFGQGLRPDVCARVAHLIQVQTNKQTEKSPRALTKLFLLRMTPARSGVRLFQSTLLVILVGLMFILKGIFMTIASFKASDIEDLFSKILVVVSVKYHTRSVIARTPTSTNDAVAY